MIKIVLITGASQGLGKALTKRFIQLGHTVIGCARNKQAMQQLQEEFGQPHNFSVVDVTNDRSVQVWSEQVLATYPSIDLLINNAGASHTPAPLWEVKNEVFDRIIDVNVKGAANVIRHFVPSMVSQSKGVIINMSSGWGRYTAPNVAPYCASKWAIEGLTKALSQELPKGMAAIPLWPGTIHTEALDIFYGKGRGKNYLSPQKWAERAVPFLLQIGASDNGKPLSIPTG